MGVNTPPEPPELRCQYLGEPLLEFADEGHHVDPKTGIARFGPKSLLTKRHPRTVRVGIIGTAETIEATKNWLERSAKGVTGDAKHPDFPGFMHDRGFYTELVFADEWSAQLTRAEVDDVLKVRNGRERFEEALLLLERKLAFLSRKDQAPGYVVVALPDKVFERCRVGEYRDRHLGAVHRDLRRAFKSVAMKTRIPTQLLRQSTIDERLKDQASKVAWNFFTGLYAKAGGFAWGPTGLTAGTCYVGISFYRPLGTTQATVQTSMAQAFDEHGDGLVLRGQDFTWNAAREGTRAPHLSEALAYQHIEMVLERYREELGQFPQRVVVHKSSRFWPDERSGFEQALRKYVNRYDLLALTPQNTIRLFPESKYPPLRGTRFIVGGHDFLYTEGFIAELGQFHSMHVPSPIQIADHIGYDTGRETLLREILALTKMNWNSARLGGLLPITLKFSRLVGDIMREIPPDRAPLTNFKFYM